MLDVLGWTPFVFLELLKDRCICTVFISYNGVVLYFDPVLLLVLSIAKFNVICFFEIVLNLHSAISLLTLCDLHVSGVCNSTLKKICHDNGLVRWPYRKVGLDNFSNQLSCMDNV